MSTPEPTHIGKYEIRAVSYTHLDVYKRQDLLTSFTAGDTMI